MTGAEFLKEIKFIKLDECGSYLMLYTPASGLNGRVLDEVAKASKTKIYCQPCLDLDAVRFEPKKDS